MMVQSKMSKHSSVQSGSALQGTEDPAMLHLVRRRLLVDLANLRDKRAVSWFWRGWGDRLMSEATEDLLELRDELQTIWDRSYVRVFPEIGLSVRGPIKAIYKWGSYEGFMLLTDDEILDRWLVWRPPARRLNAWRREGWLDSKFRKTFEYLPFRCSISSGKLLPQTGSIRAMLIVGVFEHWQHLKHCSNDDCSAPYFIAKRKDQAVCDSDKCKAEKQRQHALKWWNKNRAKKSQQGAVSKPAKEERKGNVTRKAR
jgi:hypothetical protein